MTEFVRFTLDDGSDVLFESAESDLVALHGGGQPEVLDGGKLSARLQGVAEAAGDPSGAQAVVTALDMHPAFSEGRDPPTAEDVYGAQGRDPAEFDMRREVANFIVVGLSALVFNDLLEEERARALTLVAVGADALSRLVRDLVLGGTRRGLDPDLNGLLPHHLIDLERLEQEACAQDIQSAVLSLATGPGAGRAWAKGIRMLVPGCGADGLGDDRLDDVVGRVGLALVAPGDPGAGKNGARNRLLAVQFAEHLQGCHRDDRGPDGRLAAGAAGAAAGVRVPRYPAGRATLAVMDSTEGPDRPGKPADIKHPEAGRGLDAVWERLIKLERSVPGELRHLPAEVGKEAVPAWRRVTEGEARWQVSLAVAAAILLQLPVSGRLALIRPTWLLPVLEALVAIGLIIANPRRIDRQSVMLRYASLTLIALISLANAWSAGRLIWEIVNRTGSTSDATTLLVTGGAIWVTNVIAFGLWYWEFDRGGPVARALAIKPYPDFEFPQMTSPELAPPSWEPMFADYFYLSFTNATAFSPTDVMPLSRWAKMLMLVQSAVSLLLAALVIARAVNILR